LCKLCAVEDLEAEQDEMDSSVGNMLDTSPVVHTPKSVKPRASTATGGRSGAKRCRQMDEKTAKLSVSETKNNTPLKPLQSHCGGKRLRRSLSTEAQTGQLSADQLAEFQQHKDDKSSYNAVEDLEHQTDAATGQPLSSEKRGPTQRITRRSSDLKLAESDSTQGGPVISNDVNKTVSETF